MSNLNSYPQYENIEKMIHDISEKVNFTKIKIVKNLPDFSTLNVAIVEGYRKNYTVEYGCLYIEAIVTFDSLHKYYRYFDEEDILMYADIINNVFQDRINKLCGSATKLGRNSFFKLANVDILKEKFIVSFDLFGIKDNLQPIEQLIDEVVQSKDYTDRFIKGSTLEYLDLSLFSDITKSDINKCISYNKGKEVAFAENSDYYGVPARLLKFINPNFLSPKNKKRITDDNISSVWEECDFDSMRYRIKKEFMKNL